MNDNNLIKGVRIMHVQGNVLRLAIPLEVIKVSVVNGVAEKTKEDFVPTNPVTVVLTCGNFSTKQPATMEENVARVEFLESMKLGVYSVTVYTKDDDGNSMRFKQRTAIEVVDATADAGIAPGVEFDSEAHWLDGAIYLGPIGGSIDPSGLAQIDERTNQVKYTQTATNILDAIEFPNGEPVAVGSGMIYGNEYGHIIKVVSTDIDVEEIDLGVAPQIVFLNKSDDNQYRWTGSAWQQVGGSSGGYNVSVVNHKLVFSGSQQPQVVNHKLIL